jgi:hypothetical protein
MKAMLKIKDTLDHMGAEWCLSQATSTDIVDKMTGDDLNHRDEY